MKAAQRRAGESWDSLSKEEVRARSSVMQKWRHESMCGPLRSLSHTHVPLRASPQKQKLIADIHEERTSPRVPVRHPFPPSRSSCPRIVCVPVSLTEDALCLAALLAPAGCAGTSCPRRCSVFASEASFQWERASRSGGGGWRQWIAGRDCAGRRWNAQRSRAHNIERSLDG